MSKQAECVKQMIEKNHTILIAREWERGKRTFRSFKSIKSVHKSMRKVPNNQRNLYQIDLSAWNHPSLTSDECQYLEDSYVSPFVCDVEWLSVDQRPDPRVRDRMDVLVAVVKRVLGMFSARGTGAEEATIEEEDLGRMPQTKNYFKNSFHLVARGFVFEHNAKGCMQDFVFNVLWPELEKERDVDKCDGCIREQTRIQMYTGQINLLAWSSAQDARVLQVWWCWLTTGITGRAPQDAHQFL